MATFHGQVLKVNLSDRKIEVLKISPDLMRKYMGGLGLAAYLYLDGYDVNAEALSPGNPLFIMAGPLTGTQFPGSGRFTVAARSPLTDIFGYGNAGGRFGPELMFSGFDGIVVEGSSPGPVYILVDNGQVRIEEAQDLWGTTSWECEQKIQERYAEGRKVQVMSIGQAGENRVRFATITHLRGELIGRCGMGAVMGAKNLKAVAVRGDWRPSLEPAERYESLLKEIRETVNKSPLAGALKAMGTNVGYSGGLKGGDVPIKNWALGEHDEGVDPLGGVNYTKNYLTRGSACYACPIGCKRHVAVKEGKYQTEEIPGPEYEAVAMLGSLLLNADLEAVIQANKLCNQYGMDVISAGATIAHAMEMWEREIISEKDTDGIKLTWGNMEAVLELLHRMAKRQGFGNLLAEGSVRVAGKIGQGSEKFLTTVKGLEAPAHDPRANTGLAAAYAMSPRGACHIKHMEFYADLGMYRHASVGLDEPTTPRSSAGKGKQTVVSEDIGAWNDSAVICVFVQAAIKPEQFLAMMNNTTGFEYNMEELLNVGQRIMILMRGITNIQGVTKKDDRLPERLLTPTPTGPNKQHNIDMEQILGDYYRVRGLNENGFPTRETCERLGLAELEKKLY